MQIGFCFEGRIVCSVNKLRLILTKLYLAFDARKDTHEFRSFSSFKINNYDF